MIVLVLLVIVHVGQDVDPELAAPQRGLIGAGGVQLEAARPRAQVRADQHIAARVGAHPVAAALAVIDIHVQQEAAFQGAAIVFPGGLQPDRRRLAPIHEDIVGDRGHA